MAGELTAASMPRLSARQQITDVHGLNGSQKAAILVQMILAEGGEMNLGDLAPADQLRFASDYASMVRVNRATMEAVVAEFETMLTSGSLEFPSQLDDVLQNMNGLLSPDTTTELRDRFGLGPDTDPWRAVLEMEPRDIVQVLNKESAPVGALILSKLSPEMAAETIELMDEETGKAMMLAIAQTAAVPPDPVSRIGTRMAFSGAGSSGPKAFDKDPVNRSASILNATTSAQRDALLKAFEDQDEGFAKLVRKAIFTFADIPGRVSEVDVPKFVREVPPEAMVMALVAGQVEHPAVVDYILDNMSKRMADALREEMVELGEVAPKPGEAAMSQTTSVIRLMADQGQIKLVVDEEDEEA